MVLKAVLSVVCVAGLSVVGHAAIEEKTVQIGFSDAFIPSGFDSNSDTFVVANGLFPNGCYRWNEANVSHKESNLHEIKATATVSQGMRL